MKVWLPKMAVEFSYGFSPSEQSKIMAVIRENTELFMEKWHEFNRKKK